MNKVMLVGRLTRDPELRTLPSGKPVANFVVATNEYRGNGANERTEYHNLIAWVRRPIGRTWLAASLPRTCRSWMLRA